jgi:hypothetical protein
MNFKAFGDFKATVCLGSSDSGKTSLGWKVVSEVNRLKPVYIYRHPNPNKVKKLGFKNLFSFEQLTELRDCFIWCDEPQILLPTKHRRMNESLLRLLSIARQRGVSLFFTTNDSRWLNRGLESYVDCYIVKDIDYRSLKQGSMIKNIIQDHCLFRPEDFRLPQSDFLLYIRKHPELCGRHKFKEVGFFDDSLSKCYK